MAGTSPVIRFDYTGRTVLVTGGTTGIGAAIARAYLDAGAEVIVTGRASRREDYKSPLSASHYRKFDLAAAGDAEALANAVPKLDILINNAGGTSMPEDFAAAVETNLNATQRLTAALRPMLARSDMDGGASVINVLSMMAFFGNSIFPGYSAAKAGLLLLTKSLATAWAKERIRVNAVAPGPVRTRMTERYADDPTYGPMTAARMAIGRWGEPADIAAPVLFLTSPGAAFITGECLAVSGGYLVSEA